MLLKWVQRTIVTHGGGSEPNQNMKRIPSTLALIAALTAAGMSQLHAQTPTTVGINTAIEVEYQTELGKSYTLQGSTNFTSWTDLGEYLPGTGRNVDRIYSTKNGGEVKFNYYRLAVADGPTNGFAPWTLGGIDVELDDQPGGDVTKFLTNTNGENLSEGDTDQFSYLFSRLSDNSARADLTYASNRTETLTFEFTGLGVGTWSRDVYRSGKLKNHGSGPFRIVGVAPVAPGTSPTAVNPNVVTAPPVAPPAPPASLAGLVYYFQSSGVPDRYDFIDGANGREIQGVVQEGLPTNSLAYTYTITGSNTAFLRLSFGYYGMGGDRYDCDLTFTDGSSGHFVRHLYRRGVLKDTDDGAFSQNSEFSNPAGNASTPPPASTNTASVWPPVVTPTAPPAPPTALFGKTYFVYTSPSPDQYQFSGTFYGYATPNAGRLDEVETTPGGNVYMYTYSNTAPNTATLVITYGYYNLGGDREEYDLTYVDGSTATFNRRLYRLGTLYTNQAGIFSTNPVLPYAVSSGGSPGGGSTNPPPNTNPPPSTATGHTFHMNTGENLTFTNSIGGSQADASGSSNFTYTYAASGAYTYALHVQLKSDKWDNYTLNFTDGSHGSFTRVQYRKGVYFDTDSDTFTITTP